MAGNRWLGTFVGLVFVFVCSIAVAQVSDAEGPGMITPDKTTDLIHSSVIETNSVGIVEVQLDAMHNGAVKWSDDTFVVTNAPSFTYVRDIPVGTFGLAPGDTLQTLLTVTCRSGPLNGLGTLDLHTTPVVDSIGGIGIVPVPGVPLLREIRGLLKAEARRQNPHP